MTVIVARWAMILPENRPTMIEAIRRKSSRKAVQGTITARIIAAAPMPTPASIAHLKAGARSQRTAAYMNTATKNRNGVSVSISPLKTTWVGFRAAAIAAGAEMRGFIVYAMP